MNRLKLATSILLLCAAAFSNSGGRSSAGGARDYSTLGKDPRRDTAKARELNTKAVKLIENGDWKDAEAMLKKALQADVTFGPAHNNLGNVYFQTRQLYLAAWEYQYASQLMPYHPEPRNNLGLVFEAVGKLDEAVQAFDGAREIEPDNPQFLGNSARARFRRGDRDQELKDLLQKLILRDHRPEWILWAHEQLVMLDQNDETREIP